MKCNMGTADRLIRLIVGIAIAGVGYYYDSWWAFVALVPLTTAYLGHCATYRLFGWSTLSKHGNKQQTIKTEPETMEDRGR